jgi:hypothetical protein
MPRPLETIRSERFTAIEDELFADVSVSGTVTANGNVPDLCVAILKDGESFEITHLLDEYQLGRFASNLVQAADEEDGL